MPNADPRRRPLRFRVRGEVEGGERSFLLAPGDNLIGSSEASQVQLFARGVSRRHAVVKVDGDTATVEDLGSKNGTQVNGRWVNRSLLVSGDRLRFGSAALLFETIDEQDAVLGLELAAPAAAAGPAAGGETTQLSDVGREQGVRWLEVVEGFLARLGAGSRPGDPAAALSHLREALSARAVAVLEGSADGPLVVAAAGEPGEVPTLADTAAQRARPGEVFPVRSADGQAFAGMAVQRRGSAPLVLVVWGDSRLPATAPLLRTLVLLLERFLPQELHPLRAAAASGPPGLVLPSAHLVGESPAVAGLYQELRAFAQSDLPVLVVGETGVGKEHVARILHLSSLRKDRPFIAVNCAAIPADLLEAELFGIGKGVATGVSERAGRFVEAQGGTLLLDEIGDMPLALQAKLLRALQDREVHPLGRPAVAVDVRVIAATNSDLPVRMRDGRFRSDLYYRIAGGVVRVPPLRERREDLPRLIGHFLRLFAQEAGKPIRGLTVKALRALCDYPWPGNVRELEHEVRRLVYLCPPAEAIDSGLLSDHILNPPPDDLPGSEPATLDLNANLEAVERRLIALALDKAGGNQSAAARLLGISRNGLAQRIKRLGLG